MHTRARLAGGMRPRRSAAERGECCLPPTLATKATGPGARNQTDFSRLASVVVQWPPNPASIHACQKTIINHLNLNPLCGR